MRTCEVCPAELVRRSKEDLRDFKQRRTCGGACADQLRKRGPTGVSKLSAAAVSCGDCQYRYEDSDLGIHCGPCTDGDQFQLKAPTIRRRVYADAMV